MTTIPTDARWQCQW